MYCNVCMDLIKCFSGKYPEIPLVMSVLMFKRRRGHVGSTTQYMLMMNQTHLFEIKAVGMPGALEEHQNIRKILKYG